MFYTNRMKITYINDIHIIAGIY